MTELENRLRAMLHDRAGDIDTVPPAVRPQYDDTAELLDLAPRRTSARHGTASRRRRSGWLLAAAVVTALVAAGGVVVLHRDDRPNRPGRSQDPTGPTVSLVTSVAECRASLPAGWNALRSGAGAGGYRASDVPLAIRAADGAVLVSRDDTRTRTVELIKEGTTRTLLRLTDAEQRLPVAAGFARNDAVIGLARSPRGSNGAGMPLMEIVVVDVGTTKPVHTITTMTEQDFVTGGRSADGMAVLDQRVFWDSRPRYDSRTGSVMSYDVTTGRTATVHTGERVRPFASAGGIAWQSESSPDFEVTVPAGDVPAPVRAVTDRTDRASLSTAGGTWAWYDASRDRIGWFDGLQIRWVSGRFMPSAQGSPGAVVVAGNAVFFSDAGDGRWHVVDTSTGATAVLPAGTAVVGAGDTSVITAIDQGKEGSVTGRADVSRLPALTC